MRRSLCISNYAKIQDEMKNILFDLDGTLTDPKDGIINSIIYSLGKLGINETDTKVLESFIGPPLRDSFLLRYHLSEELADNAINYYREYFSEKGIFENEIYPGVKALLDKLYNQKYNLFIATSKPTFYAEKIIKYFKLDIYFKNVVGSNLDNTRTDKSEIISHIVSTENLNVKESIMIGDRKHDIIGANNNLLKSIWVSYGYGSFDEIESYNPNYIVNDCKELQSIITNA